MEVSSKYSQLQFLHHFKYTSFIFRKAVLTEGVIRGITDEHFSSLKLKSNQQKS